MLQVVFGGNGSGDHLQSHEMVIASFLFCPYPGRIDNKAKYWFYIAKEMCSLKGMDLDNFAGMLIITDYEKQYCLIQSY